jgi:hypothetical protein
MLDLHVIAAVLGGEVSGGQVPVLALATALQTVVLPCARHARCPTASW